MNKYRLSLTKKLETEIDLEVFAATPLEAAEIANQAVQEIAGEVRAAKINLSAAHAADLRVKITPNFDKATISEVEPSGKAELTDAYRFLLTKGYDYTGDDKSLKFENEAVFIKPLRDENRNGLNADLRVWAKLNDQTGGFDYFIESYCYQAGDENDAAPATLHLRDELNGMSAAELKESLAHYERKYRKIIFLVLIGAGKNYPPPEKPTKYGEIRKTLKIMSLQNTGLIGTGN